MALRIELKMPSFRITVLTTNWVEIQMDLEEMEYLGNYSQYSEHSGYTIGHPHEPVSPVPRCKQLKPRP